MPARLQRRPRPQAAARPAAPCLTAVLAGAPCEIYLFDAASLGLIEANPAACASLGYRRADLLGLDLPALAPGLTRARLDAVLAGLGDEPEAAASVRTALRRRDGSLHALALRLQRASLDERAVLVATGAGLDPVPAAAHAPGLVYRFRRQADGGVAFPYLGPGCLALLGLPAARLRQQPELFLGLILPEDRKSYLDTMQGSAATLSHWNWEGRIWIDAWKDVKWINLRATPQALPGAVQWEGIMTNITESRQQQLEVQHSRARLAELTAHLESVREQERARIAREIHDDLGGTLSAVKMALALLSARLAPQDAALQAKAAYVDALVDRGIDCVHRIALDLRPPVLDCGIVAALAWQLAEFEKQTGLRCSFVCPHKEIALGPGQATALFRIGQEALTNIAKHARASRVTLRLARLRHHISLKITDNGGGIWQADRAKPQSFGLRSMAERASALGGTLTLGHAAGGGTVVTVKVRLAEAPAAAATIEKQN